MIHSKHRFHGRSSLRFVYQKGSTIRDSAPMALRYVHNSHVTSWRLAVVVSRKVSKAAVVRNRIRRRIFEIVRREGGRIAPQYDLVFSVYGAELATLGHEDLRHMVMTQLEKAGVFTPEQAPLDHAIVRAKETTA